MNKKTSDKSSKSIKIPDGIDVAIDGNKIKVSGPKGSIEKEFNDPRLSNISTKKEGNDIIIDSDSQSRNIKSMAGTIAAHIRNMISGVSSGYTYKMKIFTLHFPMTVSVKGREITIKNFIGEKTDRHTMVHGNASVDIAGDEITVSGASKEDVGQTCANIEKACKLTKRDRRIFQDGIYLYKKEIAGGKK
ncbi:MAG: 50S ribosomal protein L6 [Candidatus Aenigmatarchaeota archaeon]